MWAVKSHLVILYAHEHHGDLGGSNRKTSILLETAESQHLFNDHYSSLCDYDCMGNPAQSKELSESNYSNLQPCGFVCKFLVCGLFECSIAYLTNSFSICTICPLLDGTL